MKLSNCITDDIAICINDDMMIFVLLMIFLIFNVFLYSRKRKLCRLDNSHMLEIDKRPVSKL